MIVGHVDSLDGPAVFWGLRRLAPGDTLAVVADDGTARAFAVTHVETHPRDAVPLLAIFGPTDAPCLALVTCAGTFDYGSRRYTETLVVRAELRPG